MLQNGHYYCDFECSITSNTTEENNGWTNEAVNTSLKDSPVLYRKKSG